MKIVDRKTFLQMPSGTVFCKLPMRADDEYHDPLLEGQPLMVKCDSIKDYKGEYIDFFFKSVGWGLVASCYEDQHDALVYMQQHPGEDVRFSHVVERDGAFEADGVGFAILSEKEIASIKDMLSGANGSKSKKMTIKAYREEVVVEVVYPSYDAGYFEKELLQTIVLNAYTRITRALDDDDERDRKDVEKLLLDRWMSILGSFYRDYATHVELSKYEHQSQTVYKVAFKSRFLYD